MLYLCHPDTQSYRGFLVPDDDLPMYTPTAEDRKFMYPVNILNILWHGRAEWNAFDITEEDNWITYLASIHWLPGTQSITRAIPNRSSRSARSVPVVPLNKAVKCGVAVFTPLLFSPLLFTSPRGYSAHTH
jgi:hypothetical protein